MLLRHIIFDLDGTLIDSARLTGAIIERMLHARGVKARADIALIRGMDAIGGEAMIATVMGPHSINPAAEIEEFRALHRTIDVPADLPFPGVREGLDALRAGGIGLAICSNKPQDLCEKILRDLGLAQHFTAIIGSALHRPRKPDPHAALLALAGVGGSVADTLYCGDSAIDVAAAAGAGLPIALVAWGYGTREALLHAPCLPVLTSLSELTDGIEGHGRLRPILGS
jgi:phosphoglycolate phosphatase